MNPGGPMFLDIHELQRHRIQFAETLLPGRIDFGEDVWQVANLESQGSADLVAQEIHLQGSLQTVVEVPCARCLERTRREVALEFDLSYQPIQTIAREEDVEIRGEDLNIGFYHGDGFYLEDVLREQVLLSLPMRIVCRDDCAGLCPQCGQNRNLGDCGCRPPLADVRWSPLANWRK